MIYIHFGKVYNFIDRKTSNNLKLSLKIVFDEFKKAPYGFVNDDIVWLIAVLFGKKVIYLIKNSEQITKQKYSTIEIIRFLRDRKLQEKIIIEKKVGISSKEIRSVKTVLKEFFKIPNTPDDDEKLKDLFIKKLEENESKFEKILSKYFIEKRYPGKPVIEEAQELFKEVNKIKSTKEFYTFVSDKSDVFLDLSENIGSISTFFNGPQMDLFKNACLTVDKYENNKDLLEYNDNLISNINSIKNIIEMDNPFSNIHKLPELTSNFEKEFETILNKEKEVIKKYIDDDKSFLLEKLNSEELKNNFESKINKEYGNRIKLLKQTEDIAKIKSFKEISNNIMDKFLEKIDNFSTEKTTTVPQPPQSTQSPQILKSQKLKNIKIEEILKEHIVSIKTKKDIEDFVNSLKKKLEEEYEKLDENGLIHLRLD